MRSEISSKAVSLLPVTGEVVHQTANSFLYFALIFPQIFSKSKFVEFPCFLLVLGTFPGPYNKEFRKCNDDGGLATHRLKQAKP